MSIHIEELTKKFQSHSLFNRLSLDLPIGETTILTGRSGSGKTTLLRILSGLDTRFEGKITGVPDKIAFMFQEDRLLPWYSAYENIAFVLRDVMKKEEIDEEVPKMIHEMQLDGHEHKMPSKLSGGMKRRVAMARAFCYPSGLLLMDEPFKGLDTELKRDLITLFERRYVDTGKTAILVTHDEYVISRLHCHTIDLG
jgi:NitT/TauT family transport system ATP-binding protein